MTLYRLIAPSWLLDEKPSTRRVLEGEFTDEEITKYNKEGYNIYYLPNHPSTYSKGTMIDGTCIDVFNCVFVDFDTKTRAHISKDEFIETVIESGIEPTRIVDSGHGVHVYWNVSNLDSKSYLRFQRRLTRLFNTDEAVGQIFQLMRKEGTINTKAKDAPVNCVKLYDSDKTYTCEELDSLLPALTKADEAYCEQHYDKTHGLNQNTLTSDVIPPKFGK